MYGATAYDNNTVRLDQSDLVSQLYYLDYSNKEVLVLQIHHEKSIPCTTTRTQPYRSETNRLATLIQYVRQSFQPADVAIF